MLRIYIQKNNFKTNGAVYAIDANIDFRFTNLDELPGLLFEKFYKEITAFLDCTQIYFFARAQFIPDTYSYVTHTNDSPQLFSSEIYGCFEKICGFLEGRKRQVVQTIWQAYDGDSNVVIDFYYTA